MAFTATFDKELELRNVADGAETTTATEQAVALDADKFDRPFAAVVNVTALDRATGDETYVLSIEADTSPAFGSAVAVASLPAITTTGRYEIPLTGALIEQHEPGATHIRIKAYTLA